MTATLNHGVLLLDEERQSTTAPWQSARPRDHARCRTTLTSKRIVSLTPGSARTADNLCTIAMTIDTSDAATGHRQNGALNSYLRHPGAGAGWAASMYELPSE